MPRPPEPPIWFLDECVDCDSVYDALVVKGALVERHRDHFEKQTQDAEWLPVMGERGWFVLTKDDRVRKVQIEIDALWNSRAGVFILRTNDVTGPQMGSLLQEALPEMGRIAHKMSRPFIARVSKSAAVQLIKDSGRKAAQGNLQHPRLKPRG